MSSVPWTRSSRSEGFLGIVGRESTINSSNWVDVLPSAWLARFVRRILQCTARGTTSEVCNSWKSVRNEVKPLIKQEIGCEDECGFGCEDGVSKDVRIRSRPGFTNLRLGRLPTCAFWCYYGRVAMKKPEIPRPALVGLRSCLAGFVVCFLTS